MDSYHLTENFPIFNPPNLKQQAMVNIRPQPSATISLRMSVLVVIVVHKDPETWDADFSGGLTDRGYTMHEHLDDFGLINMNGRVYDPLLGRFLSPDNYIQSPDNPQNYNRYAYALNNPLVYTDPDGEFLWAAIAAGLLFTDIGYDIQKAISPVAVHIDLDFGTHGNGIGMDVSVGVPQTLPINYRYDVGASYYFNRVGGYGSGWQVRNGAEWGVGIGPFQIQHEGMRFRDWNKDGLQADQVVHTTQIGTPFINASYSNDTKESFPWAEYVPFIPKLRDGNIYGLGGSDRYRTASGRLRFGLFEAGFFLHTGEGDQSRLVDTDGDGVLDTRAIVGGNIDDARRSNGILYFGFAGMNIGWDSEGIRQSLQNDFAHDYLNGGNNGSAYPWVLILRRNPGFVFQFGGF